jgi:hypothetical protein
VSSEKLAVSSEERKVKSGVCFRKAVKRYKSVCGKDDFDIAKTEPFLRVVESLDSEKSMRITLQENAVKVRLNFKGEDYVLDYNFQEPDSVFILSRRNGKLFVKDCNLSEIPKTLERFR